MKLNVTPSVLEEWVASEIGSWIDARYPEEGHVYNILSRYKSLIEIRSTKEAALLIKSAHYQGDTTGLDPALVSKRRAIGSIGDKLIEAYGFYYGYPSFKSIKTGEAIPDPTKENEDKTIHELPIDKPLSGTTTVLEAESRYSVIELQRMASEAGISPAGSKRHLCQELIRRGLLK